MTSDPQQPAAAAPQQQAGPLAAIEALGAAVARAHQSLTADIGQDDVTALRCIIELDNSLSGLEGLLGLLPDQVREQIGRAHV